MTNSPDATVDGNGKILTGGLAQPHSRVVYFIRLFRWRKKLRWVDLTREQRKILLSITKAK